MSPVEKLQPNLQDMAMGQPINGSSLPPLNAQGQY